MRQCLGWIAMLGLLVAAPAGADTVGTFTLDGLSYVSFQDDEVLPLPSGSTIRFHFGEPLATGSVSFTIAPGDVSIPPISLSGGETLQYSLGSAVSGVMQPSETGSIITFTASIEATLEGSEESDGTQSYLVPFTTETVSATTALGSVEATGVRLDGDARYAQLVGATQNKPGAIPEPGKAVYTVLSGSFDQVPE